MRHVIAVPACIVVAALLSGCERPLPPAEAPAPAVPPPQAPAPADVPVEPAPPPATTPAAAAPPAEAASALVSAPADAGPALGTMKLATAPAKLGVPVELRYQFDGDVNAGRSATLHLAAVPRVPGNNLEVSVKQVPGLSISAARITAQKAAAATVYRQQVAVTKLADGPSEVRVLVTMELAEGPAFGWFSLPFESEPATSKHQPVKQR